jgi:hypothetical protein
LGGHTLPQLPQLLASVLVLMQAVPHLTYPATCEVLVCRFTQEPSQLVSEPVQTSLHLPLAHTCLAPQATGQLPQCAVSDVKSTHSPSQFV